MNIILIFISEICIWCMLFGMIYSNATVNAVPVDRYWSVLESHEQTPSTNDPHGFVGVKFREDFKQLVYNINVNNIHNITGIYLYNSGDIAKNKNSTMILDLLQESKEVKVKDRFKEANILL